MGGDEAAEEYVGDLPTELAESEVPEVEEGAMEEDDVPTEVHAEIVEEIAAGDMDVPDSIVEDVIGDVPTELAESEVPGTEVGDEVPGDDVPTELESEIDAAVEEAAPVIEEEADAGAMAEDDLPTVVAEDIAAEVEAGDMDVPSEIAPSEATI